MIDSIYDMLYSTIKYQLTGETVPIEFAGERYYKGEQIDRLLEELKQDIIDSEVGEKFEIEIWI